jgi:hypothetical protein
MAHTYEELKKKTVADLREIAKGIEHEAVQGYSQLNKEHLLAAICKALNLDMHVHHAAAGADKTELKKNIRALKHKRDEALTAHDRKALHRIRQKMKHMKKKLRREALV